MATNKQVARVLRKALKMMNSKGAHWIKGTYEETGPDGQPRYCSVGAINAASGLRDLKWNDPPDLLEKHRDLRDEALVAVAHGLPAPPWEIPAEMLSWEKITAWNDNDRRKWDDIVNRFTKAIERLEGKSK